jgi:hypothetical protein
MSIKIDWSPMSADSLTLYWSDSPFTWNTLPANTVALGASDVTYTDTTVPDKSVRYYMLEAVKAGAATQYSQCLCYGNFSKTGPGGNTVLRGTWEAGYMGFVPAAQLFTISGLRTAVAASNQLGGAPADGTMTGWYKFVFKGKILFFPNNTFSTAGTSTWSQIYNLGLVYGVDGPGAAPFSLTAAGAQPAIAAPVNQKKVVTAGSDSFLVRIPKNSTLPTDQNVPDRSTFKGSEWCELMCSMTTAVLAADVPLLQPFKWGDATGVPYPLMATQHFNSLNNWSASNSNWSDVFPRAINGAASGAWISWVPVLEYIPD